MLTLPLAAVLMLGAAGPASADVPQGWSDPEPVSALEFLGVIALAPVGLALLIGLLVYLPSMARGHVATDGGRRRDSQWFGGPTRGTDELAAPDGEGSKAGGAGVRW